MAGLEQQLVSDIQRIQSLDIVPSILELICRTTGMGFSAVARVTENKWIACAVKDEINFGLKPGGELELETTICNEIRGHGQPVVIDDVKNDEQFCNHHTPKQYGFRSYISIPILLKDGTFFGTLCAIDPRPFSLKSTNMVTMFNLYADLISYHLLTQDLIGSKNELLKITETKLEDSLDEIRQYAYISQHTLQEPLRKLQLLSDMIIHEESLPPEHPVKPLAFKINTLAGDFSKMISRLSDFSGITNAVSDFQPVEVNKILALVINRLQYKIARKNAIVGCDVQHVVTGIPGQISEIFYHILHNALTFTNPEITPYIKIYSKEVTENELKDLKNLAQNTSYCKICIEDNGIGMAEAHLQQIFDLFSRLNPKKQFEGMGMGLSQAKKIMKHHKGDILVRSQVGAGTTFSLLFPVHTVTNKVRASLAG